jgi:hypothetical protein
MRIDRESLSLLRESDPRDVYVRGRGVGMHHHRTLGWFLSFSRRLPDTVERREMHSCGNTSCHSRRPPRDNKLSGLRIGRKQRRPFICKILSREPREAPREPRPRPSGARKPAPSFPMKNDLADNRCRAAPRRTASRPSLIDRFVLIDR